MASSPKIHDPAAEALQAIEEALNLRAGFDDPIGNASAEAVRDPGKSGAESGRSEPTTDHRRRGGAAPRAAFHERRTSLRPAASSRSGFGSAGAGAGQPDRARRVSRQRRPALGRRDPARLSGPLEPHTDNRRGALLDSLDCADGRLPRDQPGAAFRWFERRDPANGRALLPHHRGPRCILLRHRNDDEAWAGNAGDLPLHDRSRDAPRRTRDHRHGTDGDAVAGDPARGSLDGRRHRTRAGAGWRTRNPRAVGSL